MQQSSMLSTKYFRFSFLASLSYLLNIRGSHVTCSDQWNWNHVSSLNRNLWAWMIGYAHLPFTIVTDSAPDGGSSVCLPRCQSENEVACDYLWHEWKVTRCLKPWGLRVVCYHSLTESTQCKVTWGNYDEEWWKL